MASVGCREVGTVGRSVGGHGDRRPPRPVGDHLEQQLRADIGEGHRAQLIDADEFDTLPAAKRPAEFVLDSGLHQFIDQDGIAGRRSSTLCRMARRSAWASATSQPGRSNWPGMSSDGYPLYPGMCFGAALVLARANAEAMNRHLDDIATQVQPGSHAVLILAGAERHRTGGRLKLPDTIGIPHRPPYCPEFNPVETIRRYLRQTAPKY
jgi:hypothetical protein